MGTLKCVGIALIKAATLVTLFIGAHGVNPVFVTPASDGSSTISIDEGTTAGVSIYTVSATDAGGGAISYTLTSPATKFQLTAGTGVVSLSATIDFDTELTLYTLVIEAVSTIGGTTFTSTASMVVQITDLNDETPVITGTFTATVDEELPVGTVISGLYTANDADSGELLSYSLTGTSNFQIDSGSGIITISQVIDYDSGAATFTFTLEVRDWASPAHMATQALAVTITDINDNIPVFTPAVYYVTIPENSNLGVSVAQMTVTDADAANTVTVSIQSGDDVPAKFTVNVDVIATTSVPVDYDTLGGQNYMYILEIVGVDDGTGPNTGTATVFVTITGLNDNTPAWSAFTPVYNAAVPYSVNENDPAGTSIVTIAASDTDAGIDGTIVYSLGTITASGVGSTSGLFHMDGSSGVLTLSTNTLDGDTATGGSTSYDIVVYVTDQGTSPLSVSRNIQISVNDINDNTPTCSTGLFTATVSENVVVGYTVLTIAAVDDDETATNNGMTYSVTGGSGVLYFVSDPTMGIVTTSSTIDYEVATSYDIEITVLDSGTPSLSSTCIARITIDDANDNAPTFPATSITIAVVEDEPIGYTIATSQATDSDSNTNNNNIIVYTFSTPSAEFGIGGSTGSITTLALLDREAVPSYTVIVYGTDQGVSQLTGSLTYTVSLTDVNDNPPVITGTYDTTIDEDTPLNTVVFSIIATDGDIGVNAALTYAITNGDTTSRFVIDSGSGLLQVRQGLDRESTPSYYLEVTVTDSGTPSLSASVTASVTIGDINDNSPSFSTSHYTFSVSEADITGTNVGTVVATDTDTGVNAILDYTLAYFITGDSTHFTLDASTGVIQTAASLDRETTDTYTMIIRATDRGTNPLDATSTVTISVTDYNDNVPIYTSALYSASTTENQVIGTSFLAVTVTDNDIGVNSDIILSIDTSSSAGVQADTYIAADSTTNMLYVKQVIDRESDSSFIFDLIARDQGTPALSATAVINITVTDVNDNNPVFTPAFYSTEIAYNDDCQGTVVTITATDADTGVNADITYTTTQNNYSSSFSLNGITGDVQVVGPAVTDTTYVLYASASDAGSPVLSTVSDSAIRIDTYDPNNVIVNYYLGINCSTYLTIESTFLTQLTAVYQLTYVAPQAKRWCTLEENSTSCTVRVYVVKDDMADDLTELANIKNILTADEAFAITSNDSNGTPTSVITGGLWTQFSITKVEKYYSNPTSASTSSSWFKSTTGVAVMTSAGAIVLITIVIGLSIALYNKYKTPKHGSIPLKSKVGPMYKKRMFQYNNMDKKTNMPRVSVNDTIQDPSKDVSNRQPNKQTPQTRQRDRTSPQNLVKNRQFDGRAFDPVTGRMYGYNTGSGDRSWIRTPEGEPNMKF